MLAELLSLLMLENVHDPERPEAGFFALIDPADPAIEEICLLTDGFRNALEQAGALTAEDAMVEREEEARAHAA